MKALKEKGLSARQLARLTGISRSIILKPHNRNLTARTVPWLPFAAKMEIHVLYSTGRVLAGIAIAILLGLPLGF